MEEKENIAELLRESRELGEEMAELFNEGYINSLYKTNIEVVRAFKARYEAIGYQLKYGLITEEEYYEKLAQIRDRYFSRNSQEWHKYTEEIYDYKVEKLNAYKEELEKNLEEILQISREKFAAVEKEYENTSEKLKDFAGGTGLEKHLVTVENYYPNGGTLQFYDYSLTDIEDDIEKLKSFNASIEKLKEKASLISPEVFETFFAGLRDMPIEDAQAFADLLVKQSDEDFIKYFELYQERNELADEISASLYEDDFKEVGESLKQELEEVFSTVPEEFFTYGEMTGESFAQGFIGEIEGLFDDINAKIDMASAEIGLPVGSEQNVFSPVYYFFGDRASTLRTRLHAKNDVLYQYMRGLE